MNFKPYCFLLLLTLVACTDAKTTKQKEIKTDDPYLILVEVEATGQQGYVNMKGDTVISLGKYDYCFTDTFKTFAIVTGKQGLIGINRQEEKLFDVFMYDNGPDYIEDGLFRIQKEGKIGYANKDGKVVIPAQYSCAYPFKEGKAKVALSCKNIKDGEHSLWESEEWFFINKEGEKVE